MKSIVAFGADIKNQTILAVGDVAAKVEYSSTSIYFTGRVVVDYIPTSADRAYVYEATLLAKGSTAFKQ